MASTGDEHAQHPLCEACGEKFATVEQLSEHVDHVHMKKNS